MKKGNVVLVHAIVETGYYSEHFVERGAQIVHCPKGSSSTTKGLYRWTEISPWQGLVVGTSYRATGHYNTGQSASYDYGDDGEPPYLMEDKRHSVIMVQPLYTLRWCKPTPCLEQDLELIEGANENLN